MNTITSDPRLPGGPSELRPSYSTYFLTAPHEYVPDGPVEIAPPAGYCRPEVRREAFAAVLEGVHTGAYDERMVEWLVGWDDPTCPTIASLLWRCRLARREESR